MANLRNRSQSWQECGGLAIVGLPGYDLQVSPTWGWEDCGESGAREYVVKFANCINRVNFQWVNITVRTEWNTTRDHNNRATIHGTTIIKAINISGYTPWSGQWNIVFRTGSGAQIGGVFAYTGYTQGNWGEWGRTSFSYTVDPGADTPTPTVKVTNWAVGYASENDCNEYVDKGYAGMQFHNNMPWNWDSPTINSVSCQTDNGGAKFSWNVNYGSTLPSGGSNTMKVEVSNKSDFSTIVWSNSTTGSSLTAIEGALASNTKYYVRYTATNKAGKTATQTCEFITLTRNQLKNPVSVRYDREMVDLAVLYGGKIYKPTTHIFYRKCGTSAWTEWSVPEETAKTTTTAKVLFTGLDDDTCYEVQARTTTTAGTYYGNVLQFKTAERDKVSGIITSVEPYIDDNYVCHAKICFRVYGNCTPITAHLEYRIKNGYSPIWQPTEDKVYPDEENTDCVVLDELVPNQTTYEVRVHASCGVSESDGDITEFITPLLPVPENHNCENYQYMVDMICQSLDAIKDGMKTIYANEDAKQLCDPYSENPTFAAMWSRVLRFLHGAICVMCDMTDVTLKSGLPGQVYMGEIGWSDIDHVIDEDSGEFIATSDAIRERIDEGIHLVWHSHGKVTYLVQHTSDLPTTGVHTGETALVADDDGIYTYGSSGWSRTEDADSDDFTVVYVEKASDTDLGQVKAHSSWYYFANVWQHLDADTRDLENRLDTIESTKFVKRYNSADGDILIQHNDESFNYSTLPSGKRVICFVVEDTDKPPAGMYRVTFDTGPNATIVADQDVVSGATAAQPPVNPVRVGYVFDHWEDAANPGVVFNWNTVILRNYTIKAIWNAQTCTVSYDINGGTGTTPTSVTVNYGDAYPLPSDSGFSRTGYHFTGWAKDGVPITSADLVDGDTTLTAIWEANTITITFHPNNGGSDIVKQIPYGGGVSAFADPTKTDNVFLGWFYSDNTSFAFDSPMYADTDIYAHWAAASYTVTFQPGGGNSDFTQTVNYNATATEPAAPVWQLGGN